MYFWNLRIFAVFKFAETRIWLEIALGASCRCLTFLGRCYPSGIKVFQALEAEMIAILLEQVIIARL